MSPRVWRRKLAAGCRCIGCPTGRRHKHNGALGLFNRRGLEHQDGADEQIAVLIAGQMARAVEIATRRNAQQHDRLMTIGQMLSSVLHDLKDP